MSTIKFSIFNFSPAITLVKRWRAGQFSISIPFVIFNLIFLVILFVNFPVDKWFIGWDALNPEFNFLLNFKKAIFASWQENYGVGLTGGHGFAATLPHTIITFLFSLVLPQVAIRPAFTFLCLYLGGLGMFFLLKEVVKEVREIREIKTNWIALFSSLFYMFNLGTIQMFYVQLETFIVHFASLPWLFWITIKVLQERSKTNLILFFFINFFATTQGFIPSLFVVYSASLIVFFLVYIFSQENRIAAIKNCSFILILTFLINSYWLLPLAYYQFGQNSVFLESYNNLTSTRHFIDLNQKYGDFKNVAILKGYLFDSYELGDYILKPYISHLEKLPVLIIAYSLFVLSLFGLIYSFIRIHNWIVKGLAFVFLLFFICLATDFPPFSFLTSLLQHLSPTYVQAFRTAFTKFSIGVSFSYSIFLGIGLLVILKYLKPRKYIFLTCILFCIGLFYYSIPSFSGNFLYKKLLLKMPQAYFEIMDFFKDKEDGRIADFPQDCAEGWFTYKWGYFGSGFYWYGVKQPFMARTFDVWSNYNENYYWEITQALKEENYAKIDSLFQKYDIRWILFDPNFIYCRSQRGIFTSNNLLEYLSSSPKYQLIKKFDKEVISPIFLFQNNAYRVDSDISLKTNLPNVFPIYKFNDNDLAYYQKEDYISSSQETIDAYYPFRSLLSKRRAEENDFGIENKENFLVLKNKLPSNFKNYVLEINKYSNLEKGVAVNIQIQNASLNTYVAKALPQFPQVYLDNIKIFDLNTEIELGRFESSSIDEIKVFLDGEEVKREGAIYKGFFYFGLENKVEITQGNSLSLKWIGENDNRYQDVINKEFSLIIPSYQNGILEVLIPKINDNKLHGIKYFADLDKLTIKSCNGLVYSERNKYETSQKNGNEFIRFISQDSGQCVVLQANNLLTNSGYLVETRVKNISGNSLKFSVLNKSRFIIDSYLSKENSSMHSFYYLIPPTFKSEIGYDFNFDNSSENNNLTINDFYGIGIWEIPYNFLKTLEFSVLTNKSFGVESKAKFEVEHPNETFYAIKFNDKVEESTLLILSQGYDQGWKAYEVKHETLNVKRLLNTYLPFVFGRELKEHVLVNNWANGWFLNNNYTLDAKRYTLVIIFWPQYLEFIGFGLLIMCLVYLLVCNKNTFNL